MKVVIVSDPLPGLYVRQDGGSPWWAVMEDYEVRVALDGAPGSITVPAGYRYNRASIPEIIPAWIVNRDDLGCVAPLIHDAIYRQHGDISYPPPSDPSNRDRAWAWPWMRIERGTTDELFYRLMLADKVRPWRARVAFRAVRIFGGAW
jgi:hypothetical protein